MAVNWGEWDMAKILIKNGAGENQGNDLADTAIKIAVRRGDMVLYARH